jgi:16S rRNA (guanine1516-N2)-methyltransferase
MTGSRPIQVVAGSDDPDVRRLALELARALSLPEIQQSEAAPSTLILGVSHEGVELRELSDRPGSGVRVDFRSIDLRTGTGNLSRRQPLARAVGRRNTTVLDATAGLGHDAALLALMGFEVTAVERSPVVAALLRDGAERALAEAQLGPALGNRLRVLAGDARAVLPTLSRTPEVVYIDPMFPPKRKRGALAKKSVRLLRDLVGDDPDAGDLLEVAMQHAGNRVVVKRPAYADPIGGRPAHHIGTKLVRYDVYLV